MRIRMRHVVTAAVAASALAVPSVAEAATRTLRATVGPDETITLTTATGKRVRTLRAGVYRIVIRDRSDDHNFHLRGRGLNRTTGVDFVGTTTIRVRLRRGIYRFVCDPHSSFMKGSFRVR